VPIYEFKLNCKCDKIIDVLTSVDNRNNKEVYCIECDKDVPAQRKLSTPLIQMNHPGSMPDKKLYSELEID
jgi:hypothetical protein